MTDTGFVTVPGARLYYEVQGSGPTLLLIHAGVANLRMWDPQVAALGATHQVVRYDTRGFGKTESEDVEFSNRQDVLAVLDHVGADRAVVVGASRGGIIALDTVVEHPDRFNGFVSVAGGVGGYEPTRSSWTDQQWEEAERRWEAGEWEWLADRETELWVDGPGQPADRVLPEVRAKVHDWILTNYRAKKEYGQPIQLDRKPVDRLGEVSIPTLVVIGDLDEVGTIESGEFLAAGVSGARTERFPDCAHMLSMEQPERFAMVISEFLATV